MNAINRQLTLAHIAVTGYIAGAFDRVKNDRGQGSVEYVGIVLVAAAIVAALLALIKDGSGETLGRSLINKITQAVNKLQP